VRLVAITMVRNEEDVLEAFVRHTAQLVDEIAVVDHRSADRSPEILERLVAEGIPLVTSVACSPVHRQRHILTALMRAAVLESAAGWVLPLDADELLRVGSREELEGLLGQLPGDRPAFIRPQSYVPTPADDPAEQNPYVRIRHRRAREVSRLGKVAVPARLAADPALTLAQGSHFVLGQDGQPLEPGDGAGLSIAHYPVRSPAQLARKAFGGWLAELARSERGPRDAFQWKRAFDELADGWEISPERLQELALAYTLKEPREDPAPGLVEDPFPLRVELRYTAPLTTSPLAVLARTAETLVEDLRGRA
jgi:hypothetical protein